MATLSDRIVRLADEIDSISGEAADSVARYFATLNPTRLADPTDTAYDDEIRENLQGILLDAMMDAHRAGRAVTRAPGAVEIELPSLPVLEREIAVAFARVDGNLVRMGASLDTYLRVAEIRGVDPRDMLDTIERALTGADTTGVGISSEITAIQRVSVEQSLSSAVHAGEVEQAAYDADTGIRPAEILRRADNAKETWVTSFVNSCDECISRHGTKLTHEEWEARGTPQLHPRCRCVLIPEAFVDESVRQPVDLRRAREARVALRVEEARRRQELSQ